MKNIHKLFFGIAMAAMLAGCSEDKENNPIVGIVFKEWQYGYGGVNVFFNADDMTLTY